MCAQMDKVCQYCQREVNTTTNRLIQEFCGHNKCRRCFIQEKNGCKECQEELEKSQASPRVSSAPCKMKTAWAKMVTAEGELEEENPPKVITPVAEENSENSEIVMENEEKSLDSEAWQIDTDAEESGEQPPEENVKESQSQQEGEKKMTSKHPEHVKKLQDGSFECLICQRQFSSRHQRMYHMYCDKSIRKPKECPQCHQRFVTANHLKCHLESHEQKEVQCNLCSKKFTRMQSLRKHQKIHKAEHEHKCSKCPKTYPFRFQLKQHELQHDNSRPHKCAICDRAFVLKENLKKHLLIHTNEKKFVCDVCGRKFTRNTTLKVHRNTHEKKRPFIPCSFCGKTFVDARGFVRHSKTHSSNLTFNCSVCKAVFKRKDNLRRHVKVIHPDVDLEEVLTESMPNQEDQEEPQQPVVTNSTISRACSVIKFTGNAKLPDPEPATTVTNEEPSPEDSPKSNPVEKQPEQPPKPKKPYDPFEIYRKILCPSRDDEEESPATGTSRSSDQKDNSEGGFVHWRKRTLNFSQDRRDQN
ncbi:hypothetical protein DMENIID0001_134130 [Sergentomyia squamirostris]